VSLAATVATVGEVIFRSLEAFFSNVLSDLDSRSLAPLQVQAHASPDGLGFGMHQVATRDGRECISFSTPPLVRLRRRPAGDALHREPQASVPVRAARQGPGHG
jgi:hypothetical protein